MVESKLISGYLPMIQLKDLPIGSLFVHPENDTVYVITNKFFKKIVYAKVNGSGTTSTLDSNTSVAPYVIIQEK